MLHRRSTLPYSVNYYACHLPCLYLTTISSTAPLPICFVLFSLLLVSTPPYRFHFPLFVLSSYLLFFFTCLLPSCSPCLFLFLSCICSSLYSLIALLILSLSFILFSLFPLLPQLLDSFLLFPSFFSFLSPFFFFFFF